jgi:hypothetical protein
MILSCTHNGKWIWINDLLSLNNFRPYAGMMHHLPSEGPSEASIVVVYEEGARHYRAFIPTQMPTKFLITYKGAPEHVEFVDVDSDKEQGGIAEKPVKPRKKWGKIAKKNLVAFKPAPKFNTNDNKHIASASSS